VKTYSHGMRARLALAQALLPGPELLILDEPGDGLDPEGIHEMRQTVLRLRRELGLTILLSSHLLNEMEQLCTRIAVLKNGRKVFEGTLAEAKCGSSWLRVKVGDFDRAVQGLHSEGLITGHRDGCLVLPADGVGSDTLVRRLVEQGMPVFEVAPEQDSLESFYLSLMSKMQGSRSTAAKRNS
jgi:ABC-2 type transport system ATP-binding protein